MSENFDEKTAGLDETLEGVYERIWTMHDGEPLRALDESLGPRPPEMLLTYVEGMGLQAGARARRGRERLRGRRRHPGKPLAHAPRRGVRRGGPARRFERVHRQRTA